MALCSNDKDNIASRKLYKLWWGTGLTIFRRMLIALPGISKMAQTFNRETGISKDDLIPL